MFDANNLRNVVLEFKIPFALDLEDSFDKEDLGKGYKIDIDDVPVMIRTKRNYNENSSLNGAKIAPYSKIEKDRFGILSTTTVQVWFYQQSFNSPRIEKDMIRLMPLQFLPLALEYLNKLIRVYKQVKFESWIPQLTEREILALNCILIDNNREEERVTVTINQPVTFNGGKNFSHTPIEDKLLRNSLVKNDINLQLELVLAADNNFDRMEYNLALIQCAIRFENYVYTYLNGKLSNTKLNNIKKKEPCGCLSGIYEVCTKGILSCFGFDFGNTDEFKAFHEKVLKIRNDLVHGERLDSITKEQCSEAIKATSNALMRFEIGFFNRSL